jgi:hypothetical protein
MPVYQELMASGVPALTAGTIAKQTVLPLQLNVIAAGFSFSDAPSLKEKYSLIIGAANANPGVKLPSDMEIGVEYIIKNSAGTGVILYTPVITDSFNRTTGATQYQLFIGNSTQVRIRRTTLTNYES